jgi:predicted lipid-binding transport protein (Tim44 family)
MRRSTVLTLIAVVVFTAFLLYSTLASQRAQCIVTVEYEGRRNEATASAATEREAEQQARTTACGPIAAGMNATIACTNRTPVKRECRTL